MVGFGFKLYLLIIIHTLFINFKEIGQIRSIIKYQ